MKKQLYVISMKKATILNVILLVVSFFAMLILQNFFGLGYIAKGWVILIGVVATLICFWIHELLHALGFIVFGRAKINEVKIGGKLSEGMLFCTTTKPLTKTAYIMSLFLPLIATVIGCVFVVLYLNFFFILFISLLLSGCAGDIIMAIAVAKLPCEAKIIDHESVPGFFAVYDDDNAPPNFIEATREMEDEAISDLNKYKEFNKKTFSWKKLLIIVGLGIVFGVVLGIILVVLG